MSQCRCGRSQQWTSRSDQAIRQDVEAERWWGPFVDAEHISVQVADGGVTLIGEVDTWKQRFNATINAFDGGAQRACNNLSVKSTPIQTRHWDQPSCSAYYCMISPTK